MLDGKREYRAPSSRLPLKVQICSRSEHTCASWRSIVSIGETARAIEDEYYAWARQRNAKFRQWEREEGKAAGKWV